MLYTSTSIAPGSIKVARDMTTLNNRSSEVLSKILGGEKLVRLPVRDVVEVGLQPCLQIIKVNHAIAILVDVALALASAIVPIATVVIMVMVVVFMRRNQHVPNLSIEQR